MGSKIAAALDGISIPGGKKVSYSEIGTFEKQLKAQRTKDGFFKISYLGEETYVTWGYGHVCEMCRETDYNKDYKNWRNLPLPFLPHPYRIKLNNSSSNYPVVKNLFSKSRLVICATDDDREGDLIFAYLYQYMGCKVPFKRALFNSVTEDAIVEAFKSGNLVDSSVRMPVIDAGRARSVADAITGWNMTAAFTLKCGVSDVLSIGRVQTAALDMIVERENEILNFKPEKYYVASARFTTKNNEEYEGACGGKYATLKDAESHIPADGTPGTVTSVKSTVQVKENPLLFSLATLQMEANSRFGFTLSHTQELAQSLYDKSFTTYPRTDSSHLTSDMVPEMERVFTMLESTKYGPLVTKGTAEFRTKHYFDTSKVTGHFAIIPTHNTASGLKDDEEKLYDLIVRSVIAMRYPPAKTEHTDVTTTAGGFDFISKGTSIKDKGWMEILGTPDEKFLPNLSLKEQVFGQYSAEEKQTKPPKRYTDKTMVAAMLTCGKTIEDAELAKMIAAQENGSGGIGRPSTRAEVLKKLESSNYITRQKKSIIPTEKGIWLIKTFPIDDLKSPVITAEWEKRLDEIEKNKDTYDNFIANMEGKVSEWTKEVNDMEREAAPGEKADGDTGLTCPSCGKPIIKYKWGYGCSGYKEGCRFSVGKIAGKTLSEKQVTELIKNGKIGPISGFKSKQGKAFSASLKVSDDGSVGFVFDTPEEPKLSINCPVCGKPMRKLAWGWSCTGYPDCKFAVGKIAGKELSDEEVKTLIEKGRVDSLNGFVSKKGNTFTASLVLADGKVNFEFPQK